MCGSPGIDFDTAAFGHIHTTHFSVWFRKHTVPSQLLLQNDKITCCMSANLVQLQGVVAFTHCVQGHDLVNLVSQLDLCGPLVQRREERARGQGC